MLVGYPDANLVTAAGGVLVHVENRPANAAHVLHLNPGDIANADVESSALDINGSGNPCPREGTLVVTPPGDSVSHELPVALPICTRPSARWIKSFFSAESIVRLRSAARLLDELQPFDGPVVHARAVAVR